MAYSKSKNKKNPKIKFPFNVGDHVHVLSFLNPNNSNKMNFLVKQNYTKTSTPKYTEEIFTICEINLEESNENIIRYKLINTLPAVVTRKYYHHELSKVYYF